MARFVRLRLQKIRTLHGDLIGPERSLDKSVMRRYFYSIKDISIGGHCVCFGHASECIMDPNIKVFKLWLLFIVNEVVNYVHVTHLISKAIMHE